MESAREYIARKGWQIHKEAKESGGTQLILRFCPICGAESKGQKRRFYINEEGFWNCYGCGESGNLYMLKKKVEDIPLANTQSKMGVDDNGVQYLVSKFGQRLSSRQKTKTLETGAKEELSEMQDALWEDRAERVLKYLHEERGFTDETIKKFGLGYAQRHGWKCQSCGKYTTVRGLDPAKPDHCGKEECKGQLMEGPPTFEVEALAMPIYQDGELVNIKFRHIPPGKKIFERVAGSETTIFNIDALKGEFKRCFITEAETDAMALEQYGIGPCVGLTSGAQSGAKLIERNRERFADFSEIFIVLDNDEEGEKASPDIAGVLGSYRCRRVYLPLKDANECLIDGVSKEVIEKLIDESQFYSKQLIRHISEFEHIVETMFDVHNSSGVSTGWAEHDDHIVELGNGHITLVTGDTGSGKTTFTSRLALNVVEQEHKSTLICSPELTQREGVKKLISMVGGKSARNMSKDERIESFLKLADMPLYFLDHYGRIPFAELSDVIEYGVRQFGLWLIVLDHLHFFIGESSGGMYRDERVEIENALYQMLELARQFNIHLVLVVHPKNLRRDNRSGNEIPPDLGDLKGSSEIKKIINQAARVHRPRTDKREQVGLPKAVVTWLKVREDDGHEGAVAMRFWPETMDYTPWTEEDEFEDKRLKRLAKKKKKEEEDDEGGWDVDLPPKKEGKPKPTQTEMGFGSTHNDGEFDDDEIPWDNPSFDDEEPFDREGE